jgi:hypothetical protein
VKVFLDECVDWRLARDIVGHDVKTARQMAWTIVKNSELLTLASQHFDVFTVDRNLPFQQDLDSFSIAVVRRRRSSGEDESACRSQAAGFKPPGITAH